MVGLIHYLLFAFSCQNMSGHKSLQGRARKHNVVWHQDVGPRLAAILLGMDSGTLHPFRGGACFCLNDWIIDLVRGP
jgi:hypothetical protein